MRYFSVCSGIHPEGRILENELGWECAGFSEVDLTPISVLRYHYPHVKNFGDLNKIRGKYIVREKGKIDIITGGTPCQSFSVAGKRRGMDDPRGQLANSFLRIVEEIRPRWIVWENVPGVLSSNKGRDFSSFIRSLSKFGYGICWRILDAQYYGIPQKRRRVFLVGYLGDWRPSFAVLFERESLRRNPPQSRKTGKRITEDFGNSSEKNCSTKKVGRCLTARNERIDPERENFVISIPEEEVIDFGRTADRIKINAKKSVTLQSEGGGLGAKTGLYLLPDNPVIAIQGDGGTSLGINGPGWDAHGIAYTLNTTDRHSVFYGYRVRRLTPKECERLQGFPDDYTLVPIKKARGYSKKKTLVEIDGEIWQLTPDGARYKLIGNSWALPVIMWIYRRIAKVDSIVRMKDDIHKKPVISIKNGGKPNNREVNISSGKYANRRTHIRVKQSSS